MTDDLVTLTLPEVCLPDSVTATAAGRIIVPGQNLPERKIPVNVSLVSKLIASARAAADHAHAPYSNFHVGAALIMADDPQQRVIVGSNCENSSYGATICGERSALTAASSLGFRQLHYLALSTADSLNSPLCDRSPCGICRQSIREFVSRSKGAVDALIFVDTGEDGVLCEAFDIERLLPYGFNFASPASC